MVGFIAKQAYGLDDAILDGMGIPWGAMGMELDNKDDEVLRNSLSKLIEINDSGQFDGHLLTEAEQLELLIEKTEKLGFKVNVIEKSGDNVKEPEPELKYLGDD